VNYIERVHVLKRNAELYTYGKDVSRVRHTMRLDQTLKTALGAFHYDCKEAFW